jgi:hypothetical protein
MNLAHPEIAATSPHLPLAKTHAGRNTRRRTKKSD